MITNLIQQGFKQAEAEAEAQKRAIAAGVEEGLTAINEAAAKLGLTEGQMDEVQYHELDGRVNFMYREVDGPAMEIEPFYIVARWTTPNRREIVVGLQNVTPQGNHWPKGRGALFCLIDNDKELPAFFRGLRENWQAQQARAQAELKAFAEKRQQERLTELARNLTAAYNDRARPEGQEEAEAAAAELTRLGGNGSYYMERWLETEAYKQQVLQDLAEKQRRAETYVEQFKAYLADFERVVTRNRAALALLKKRYDLPFQVYDLYYGFVVEDEGETFVAEERATCLGPIPGEGLAPILGVGEYHQVLKHHGKVIERTFNNVSGIGKPRWVKPSEEASLCGKVDATYFVNEAAWICYKPLTDQALVEQDILDTMERLPKPPSQPEGFTDYHIENLEIIARTEQKPADF